MRRLEKEKAVQIRSNVGSGGANDGGEKSASQS